MKHLPALNDSEVPGALGALLPGLGGAAMDMVQTVARAMSAVVDETSGAGGGSSGNQTHTDKFVWMKPFALDVNQDSNDGIPGYDADVSGLVLGADDQISAGVRGGWTIGYARTDMDGNDVYEGQSIDIDTYQVGLYARKEDGDVFTTGKVRFGWSNNDSERDIR